MRWVLFDGQTADGSSTAITLPVESEGGTFAITLSGGFGGGTCTFERYDPLSEAYVTHGVDSGSAASWTSAVDTTMYLARGSYRATLSGASGATLNAELRGTS